ncbi:hypothetical protein LCGC14_2365770 [marine sediment metagenome]|uniref:Uncharacterized protein n=1 Tax=marine sediment metagenome TaxID=412755 RepID=A0A0F9CSI8_9ZZZZ
MKRLMLFIFVIIFLVGTISAFEIDNVQDYDEEKREYTITNAFGLPFFGKEIARIKLTSDLKQLVPRGYQKVAEFEVENYDNYVNVFNDMEFYDLRNSRRFGKSFSIPLLRQCMSQRGSGPKQAPRLQPFMPHTEKHLSQTFMGLSPDKCWVIVDVA